MHTNKGNKRPAGSSKSQPQTPVQSSRQRLEHGRSSVKRSGRTKDASSHRAHMHVKRVLSGKIGRRPLNGFVNKSVRSANQLRLGHRPKRNAIHRAWDYTAGLSWKEEKELKKALMASLQESKKPTKPELLGCSSTEVVDHIDSDQVKKKTGRKPKALKLQMPQSGASGLNSNDNSNKNFPVQVRAQRKFAQGSRPCSPGCSPVKGKNLNSKLVVTKKAKTEDFLTFLCLRGSTNLPPHLDFSNNFVDSDTLSSFPNTPRHSQDGSRPNTPMTNNGNNGNGHKVNLDRSRSGSPDVEITLDSHELGVKPLVGTSGHSVTVVTGGVGPSTSTRACASLTTRCTAATRCTTNALSSLSDSNSSFSATTPPSSASTPSPVDSSLGGSTGIATNFADYASVSAGPYSAKKCHARQSSSNEVVQMTSNKRYATRGKQKTVQEIIAAKEHRSLVPPRRSLVTRIKVKDAFPVKKKPVQKGSILSKIVPKKSQINLKSKNKCSGATKTTTQPQRQSIRLSKLESCPFTFSEDQEKSDPVNKPAVDEEVIVPEGADEQPDMEPEEAEFEGTCDESQHQSLVEEDELHEDEEEDVTRQEDDVAHKSSTDSASTNFKLEIATQTSDTSSYTAEIDASCLLDENTETDSSDEDSSADPDETDVDTSQTETEESNLVPLAATGENNGVISVVTSCSPEASQDIVNYSAGALQTVTTLGQQIVTYPMTAMGNCTAVTQPIVTINNCPMSTTHRIQPGINFSGTATIGQPGMITYNNNTFPIQMMGQNLILDDSTRSVLLGDATNQVISNMSVQMQGFSVQHGMSALPLNNIPSLPYVQPTMAMTSGPPQPPIMQNALATIDQSMATSSLAVVQNSGVNFHGNQSIQVNVTTVAMGTHSSVAMGTQCGSVWPQVKRSFQNVSRSTSKPLLRILPAPSSMRPASAKTPTVCTATTSALSVQSATHLKRTKNRTAAVKVVNVSSVSTQPPTHATVSSMRPPSPADHDRCTLAAQTQPLAYTLSPLPPTVMAPGHYQRCRPMSWPSTSGNDTPTHSLDLRNFDYSRKFPLETPDNSPLKSSCVSDGATQMEADTTVLDDNLSADQSNDVIIVSSTSDSNGNKDADEPPPKKRLSLSKPKNSSKSPAKSPLKRKVANSPLRSASPVKRALKMLKDKKSERSLRSSSKTRDDVDMIDLTDAGESADKTTQNTKGKRGRKPGKKPTVSVGSGTPESQTTASPRTRLQNDSESKLTHEAKDSLSSRRRNTPSKKPVMTTPEQSEAGTSKRGHLRSSGRSSVTSPGPGDSPRVSGIKKDSESHSRTSRSRTGPVPKAAIPAGFPKPDDTARLTEVPTYHPSAEQFQDPIAYLNSIWRDAESYGMCRIVPPDGWKPECEISEDLRFTTQVQYIHKVADRWGPAVKQLECIKQHLKTQGITIEQAPCVGGVELDLPSVAATIQSQGGLQSVINKNKWPKVIEQLRTPKTGNERISRLYEIYCKYLLSYDTLSVEERESLEQEVDNKYQKGSRHLDHTCTSKGRSKPLSEFFRVARNTQSMWFNEDEPTTEQVEDMYWQLVAERDQHVSIQVAHIDTKHCGSAFPSKKDSPYARHGWNYNILQHHPSSVLRHLGQVTGLTIPMLHIGMVFSTSCWARDPHFLPYIVYSHTGADVVWYCIPSSEEANLKQALEANAPKLIDAQSPIWLPEDSVMIDPNKLLEHNVSHCRTVQHQGEFVIVFPKAFTATVTCGYNISESVHFASASWLPLGCEAAQQLYASGEPDLFSMEKLLVFLATEDKTPTDTLQIILPLLEKLIDEELDLRKRLGEAGLQQAKKVPCNEPFLKSQERPRRSVDLTSQEENRCDSSCKICYFSTVMNEVDNVMFALPDALQHIRRKKNLRNCKLLYRFDQKELKELVRKVRERISTGRTPSRKKSSKNT